MKTTILVLCIIVMGLFGITACQKSSQMSDSDITSSVKEKLRSDVNVGSADIDVDTENGNVRLSGEVDSENDANHALSLARSVPQVKSVQSEIKVKEVLTNADVEQRVEDQEDKVREETEKNTDRTVANAASDAAITANVKLKLAEDPVVSALKINVDTNKGRVTLTGTVKNESEAKRAVQIAEEVDGVTQVSSVLTVKSS
jgi:hyperosmotically inducible periplasmic protein